MAAVSLPSVLATPANAVSCSFAGGILSVTSIANELIVFEQEDTGGVVMILVNGSSICGTGEIPLVEATTVINVIGDALSDQWVVISLTDTSGSRADWGSINWAVSLGSSPSDVLEVDNSDGDLGMNVVLGSSGIDLTADGDLDVVSSGVDWFNMTGGWGNDVVSGAGDATTGAAFGSRLRVYGGPGDDTIAAGASDDVLDGGGDFDLVDYSRATSLVHVNLMAGIAAGQGLDAVVDVEAVMGSGWNDVLVGDEEWNAIHGGAGSDSISGQAGDDFINGGRGKDAIDAGDDIDTCVRGGDSFTSCETFVGGGPRRF